MMREINIILSFLLLLNSGLVTAKPPTDEFLESLRPKVIKQVNRYFLEINYGPNWAVFNDNIVKSDLSIAFDTRITYGFIQKLLYPGADSAWHYSEQFTSFKNTSSHFRPKNIETDYFTIDSWTFSLGYGSGWEFVNYDSPDFNITTSNYFAWTRTDFEVVPWEVEERNEFEIYDETIKFGMGYEFSTELKLFDFLNAGISYNHLHSVPDWRFGNWLPGFLLETALLNWHKFLSEEIAEDYEGDYPLLYIIYQTAINALIYNLRSNDIFTPIDSEKPLSFRSLAISLKYEF